MSTNFIEMKKSKILMGNRMQKNQVSKGIPWNFSKNKKFENLRNANSRMSTANAPQKYLYSVFLSHTWRSTRSEIPI